MSKPVFTVRSASWISDRQEIMAIRAEVFIVEQHVPQNMEWDGLDETALHVLALDNDSAIGTGRLLHTGQIGRMAVRRDWRHRGIGSAILQTLVKLSMENNIDNLFLNAQIQAEGFYRKRGFVRTGKLFNDAGIAHCRMIYRQA